MANNKLKIRKSIARRFKVTKTGKILRRSSFARHLRSKKTKARIRRLKRTKLLSGKIAKKVGKLLGKKGVGHESKNRTLQTKKT